jgi:hypothetical protein
METNGTQCSVHGFSHPSGVAAHKSIRRSDSLPQSPSLVPLSPDGGHPLCMQIPPFLPDSCFVDLHLSDEIGQRER